MSLLLQQQYHKQAFQFITKALDLDPVSPSQAIIYYRKGLRIMKDALSLQFSPSEIQQASILQEKMNKNMIMVENRLQQLEKKQRNIGNITYTPPRQSKVHVHKEKDIIDLSMEDDEIIVPSPTIIPKIKKNTPVKTRNHKNIINTNPTQQNTNKTDKIEQNNTIMNEQNKNTKNIQTQLRGIDKSLQQLIMREIVDDSPGIAWDDIVGQDLAKKSLFEIVIWPSLRPDLFTGLRTPTKGLLLFGPPGNGKTLLAKAIATECKVTFFSISASSLVSKYVGESEKLVRALFVIARMLQPSIVFIDEIDSMLGERNSDDSDASRRLKTEFLVQLDGATTNSNDRVLILAATNRPWDLDDAVLRRLGKRIFVELPDANGRCILIKKLLGKLQHNISNTQFKKLSELTERYSGSDIMQLCKDASMGPIRELGEKIRDTPLANVRKIGMQDFLNSLKEIKPSTSQNNLEKLIKWNNEYGCSSR